MVRHLLAWTLALMTLGATAALAQGEDLAPDRGPFVVVELFTSQACPACPDADVIAAELDSDPNIIVLSWPVDIWDYLGWEDTLASPENTRRQAQYNGRFGLRWPYTPELVVDGRSHLAGNQREDVLTRIEEARADDRMHVPLRVRMDDGRLIINVGNAPDATFNALGTIWLISYRDHDDVEVGAGPNAGRTLSYVNVAERAVPISQWGGSPVILRHELDPPVGEMPDGYVVLLQEHRNGPILGAARLRLRWDGAGAETE